MSDEKPIHPLAPPRPLTGDALDIRDLVRNAQKATAHLGEFVEDNRNARELAIAHIPKEFRGASFDAHVDPVAARIAKHQRPGMVLFYGPSRAGKTTLATALYKLELERREWFGGAWIGANDMVLEAMRAKFGTHPPLVRRAIECSLLLLDDLGEEPGGDVAKSLVLQVIASRQRRHRATIVTTGLPERQTVSKTGQVTLGLVERYGDGLVQRLTEFGRTCVIECVKRDQGGAGSRPTGDASKVPSR